MKYTQIPVNTFRELQMNAGILVDTFNPATGVIGNLIGATTGGVNFADNVSYTDLGEDIDNCPKNMKELKQLESHEVTMSGTFLTVTAAFFNLIMVKTWNVFWKEWLPCLNISVVYLLKSGLIIQGLLLQKSLRVAGAV